jgi:hypothetical protein
MTSNEEAMARALCLRVRYKCTLLDENGTQKTLYSPPIIGQEYEWRGDKLYKNGIYYGIKDVRVAGGYIKITFENNYEISFVS